LNEVLRRRVIGNLPHLPLLLLPYLIRIHPGLTGLGLRRGTAVDVRLLGHRRGRTAERSPRRADASKAGLARGRAPKGATPEPSLLLLLLRLTVRVLLRAAQPAAERSLGLLLRSSEGSLGLLLRCSVRRPGLLLPHHSWHARLRSRHARLLPHGLLGHTAQHGVIDDPRGTRGRHPPLPRVVQHLLQLLHREV
jgi:hypothetical protein